MKKFYSIVNSVIDKSDIVLEVLDARFPNQTRNEKLEKKIEQQGKQLIFVINKSDLVSEQKLKEQTTNLHPLVYLSSKERKGTKKLRDLIKRYAKKDQTFVGVVGYPNTGKSSVINVLVGKAAAKTAPKSGLTRGLQWVKLTQHIKLIDTPGVLPPEDDVTAAIVGAIDIPKVKEPDYVVEKLLELFPHIKKHYGANSLEDFAKQHNYLKKKAEPDLDRAALHILKDWVQGKIISP